MSRYPVYKLSPARQKDLARTMGLPKKEAEKFCSWENCLQMAAYAAGNKANSSGVQCILTENLWVQDGREAIFIQDEETAQAIHALRVSNFDPETLPHGSWLFLLPQSLGVRPFIFAVRTYRHWREMQMQGFPQNRFGLDYGDWESHRNVGETDNTASYAITFYKKDYNYHHSAPVSRLMEAFAGTYENEKPLLAGILDADLDADERKEVAQLVQFATKALVYGMIFPDKVLDEGPKIATTDHVKPKSRTIKPAFSLAGSRGPTAIAPFFRQLRDDRFYKGEHAHMAPGTRFSLVRSHVRGTNKFSTLDEDAD